MDGVSWTISNGQVVSDRKAFITAPHYCVKFICSYIKIHDRCYDTDTSIPHYESLTHESIKYKL